MRNSALFLLVTGMGIILYFDLVTGSINGWGEKKEKESQLKIVLRTPSNLIKNEGSADLVSTNQSTIDYLYQWDCTSKKKPILLKNVASIRLKGICLKDLISLKNSQNGYTANVFQYENEGTTDFIRLESGNNRLKLNWLNVATGNFPTELELIVEKQ